MKNILKFSLAAIAVVVFNTAFAQNAVQKKELKKADAIAVSVQKENVVQQQEGKEATPSVETSKAVDQAKPASLKQQIVKTPAERSQQPLKKQVIYKEKQAAEVKEK